MQFDREKTKRDKTKTANPGDDQQEAAQSSAAPCEWPLSRREFVVGAGVGAIGVAASSSWASPILAPHATEPQEARAIPLALTINGHEKQLSVDPRTTLLDLLRENLKLTGTKKGCDHGQCGVCTMLVEGRRVNTRCYYFYDPAYGQCNKRKPGSGCAAIEGLNRIHAVLGASSECIATHPSDMCVALVALAAQVRVRNARGERMIAFADFHRLPGSSPQVDTNLRPDELILSIDLPNGPYADHSSYVKVRDRASYAFALVSTAAALELDGNTIRSARIALGGVAHKPWRCEAAESLLRGKAANEASYRVAAEEALRGARVYKHNGFKVELAKRTIVLALTLAANGETHQGEAA